MKTICLLSIGVIVILFMAACSPAATPAPPMASAATEAPAATMAPAAPASTSASGFTAPNTSGSGGNLAVTRRIVIKNATLEIIVSDPPAAINDITHMAEGMGGFIVNSSLTKVSSNADVDIPEADIAVRVPAERLDEALDHIKGLTANPKTDIKSENVTGQDVTKEYTDTQSRLKNLETARDQLQKVMDEAHKTEDILSVYNQLTTVTEQIEVLKGQIQYYEEASALSSISVHLIAKVVIKPVTVAGWQAEGIARDAIQELVTTLQTAATGGIWMGLFCLPILILAGIPLALIYLGYRRVKPQRPTPASTD